MKYEDARGLLLVAGLGIIGLLAFTMFLRDVDPVEIVGTLLYAPIFAGFVLFGFAAGAGLGVVAAGVYVGLRLPAIDLVGFAPLAGTVFSRVIGYLAFGSLGGWASEQIKHALDRFQLIDESDEVSGLGNARSIHNAISREANRAQRYGHSFSVVTASFADLGTGRRQRGILRELGTRVGVSIRTSDHAGHMTSPDGHQVVIVLPETGEEGAKTVRENLATLIRSITGAEVTVDAVTDSGAEDDPLASMKQRLLESLA